MSTRQREKAAERQQRRAEMGPHATLRYLRVAPQKVRLVVDMIRGKKVEEALNILHFSPKAAAKPVAKLVNSAVANAKVKGDINIDRLFVKTVMVDQGPTWRRWLARAMGRATRVHKHTSHVTLVLGEGK